LVSFRSGPETVVLVVEALQFFFQAVAGTRGGPAARVKRSDVPLAVPALTVTVTVPLEVALEASEGTARLPVSRRAPLFEVVVERSEERRVGKAGGLRMLWTL